MEPAIYLLRPQAVFATNETPIVNDTSIITPLNYAYLTLTCLMSSLSAVGSLLIIATYFIYPGLQSPGRKMLVHLSVADFLLTLGNFLGVPEALDMTSLRHQTTVLCVISGTVATISSISSFMWTSFIAVYMYLCIVLSRSRLLGSRMMTTVHILCWVVPVLVAVFANIFKVYGYDPSLHHMSSCWISSTVPNQLMWQFLTGKGWEIIAYFITGTFYALIKFHVHREIKHEYNLGSQSVLAIYRLNHKMTLVPIVFILLRIWGTIRFLIGVVDHSYASSPASSWIVVMQGFGDSSQGFANCVLFCFLSPKIRTALLKSLKKWTSCLRHRSVSHERARTISGSSSSVAYTASRTDIINTKKGEQEPLLQHKQNQHI